MKELKIGLVMLTILILVAIFAPYIATKDPYLLNDDLIAEPSAKYIFGTDGLGRDVFSMVIYGTRTSLKIGIFVAAVSSTIGILIGGVAGYIGGKVDRIISEIINIFLMLPTFFITLITIAIYGSSLRNIIIVMALTSWTGTARLMRSQAISLRERTFIKSAQTIGESSISILFKHIIPNGIFPIITNSTMIVSSAILSEAGLSFLGLGDPNVVSWGKIIAHGKTYLPRSWWICTFPGLAIVFTVLSFYLIGEGAHKLLNPKIRTKG
ncbi:ABC transporter permease [Tepidimicrobium xylanilyticum]|uniref:Peptide/nickel transport system permease protein n=1 Tax=Tepidimicrobium xylanilyticum TaxID=1123352 RepID=A0A1H3DGD6_9FIRM|nr:ABC transporter permease [Tepidimicrobium xylanilyticum]GMG97376.1 peptide transporter [Tepidimicrobium xylanilyticum]SDX64764.1 peptide/nickel transport system permease protein [Tepidimicrobium xylanilyticum]